MVVRDVSGAWPTSSQEAVARSAVAAMAGPSSAMPFTRFALGFSPLPSANDTTVPLTSPQRGWRNLVDPCHLFPPVGRRDAFLTPALPPTVPPTSFFEHANPQSGPAASSAHPPLRPNFPGAKPGVRCDRHKEAGMVDVKNEYDGCTTRPLFN